VCTLLTCPPGIILTITHVSAVFSISNLVDASIFTTLALLESSVACAGRCGAALALAWDTATTTGVAAGGAGAGEPFVEPLWKPEP